MKAKDFVDSTVLLLTFNNQRKPIKRTISSTILFLLQDLIPLSAGTRNESALAGLHKLFKQRQEYLISSFCCWIHKVIFLGITYIKKEI